MAAGVPVSPVNHPALAVVFILPEKFQPVSFFYTIDPWRQIYIMGDQHGMTLTYLQDDTLMTAPRVVVFQYSLHRSGTAHLQVTYLVLKGIFNVCAVTTLSFEVLIEVPAFVKGRHGKNQQQGKYQLLSVFHDELFRRGRKAAHKAIQVLVVIGPGIDGVVMGSLDNDRAHEARFEGIDQSIADPAWYDFITFGD